MMSTLFNEKEAAALSVSAIRKYLKNRGLEKLASNDEFVKTFIQRMNADAADQLRKEAEDNYGLLDHAAKLWSDLPIPAKGAISWGLPSAAVGMAYEGLRPRETWDASPTTSGILLSGATTGIPGAVAGAVHGAFKDSISASPKINLPGDAETETFIENIFDSKSELNNPSTPTWGHSKHPYDNQDIGNAAKGYELIRQRVGRDRFAALMGQLKNEGITPNVLHMGLLKGVNPDLMADALASGDTYKMRLLQRQLEPFADKHTGWGDVLANSPLVQTLGTPFKYVWDGATGGLGYLLSGLWK